MFPILQALFLIIVNFLFSITVSFAKYLIYSIKIELSLGNHYTDIGQLIIKTSYSLLILDIQIENILIFIYPG